jgi:hypothetical protein
MIPSFDERGYLPPGVHKASLEEVIDRFGHGSEIRQAQADSLRWLIPLCKSAGIARCLINGSFVTNAPEPHDVDCVLLQGPLYRRNSSAARELSKGLPFLELKRVRQRDFDFFINVMFATDRQMIAKGLVEVILND